MINKKMTLLLGMSMIGAAVFGGCSKDGTGQNGDGASKPASAKAADTTPVTLKFAVHLPINEEFKQLYIEPVTKKYPHISFEFFEASNFKAYDQLIASGEVPDLYISFNGNMPGLKERAINMDMKPLLQSHQVDLKRFEQNFLDDIQYAVTEKGELYGLPIETAFHALYYNKDIFDKFGAPYPKDGMTMEDAVELAKKVTRNENGVQYRGWDFGSIVRMAQPLGLVYIDPKTEKAVTSSESWRRVFELGKQIYSIPGNEPSKDSKKNGLNGFTKERTIAMLNETSKFSQLKEAEKDGFKWDVVQHPFYADKPNIYGNSTVYMIGAVPTTKHMEQVLQVMEVLTSDEVQMNVSKSGRISPLKNEAVKKAFGQGDPSLQNKNVAGIVKGNPVKYPVYLYREIAEPLTNTKFNDYMNRSDDVHTILRELDYEINQAVATQK
ncbi:ABC transporter substrate-binding protein [Paenibacillus ginsengarvi]|uniref:Carbohydrate ABC transporter substrate-binding protein n=1 Tax=Paenibacillus ginsengarvi TaxID=400777 RepID=A0A3B0CQT1_9BACL|nr:ABC transporter substrate-binding protein [Paenibacillus ginsengarvi]RKN86119.1 carbohydrate ABC transporter substrate-binding protein [Paenibacillus ginsengarvi]